MGARKKAAQEGPAADLAAKLGLRSEVGSFVLGCLQHKLLESRDREQILTRWRKGTSDQTGLQHRGAAASLAGNGAGGLTPDEVLLCRQTYYTLTVQAVAFNYLACVQGVKDSHCPLLKDMIDGQAFKDLGVSNLDLKGFLLWHSDRDSQWTDIIGYLMEAIKDLDLSKPYQGDLFQNFYEDLIPRQVRHSLGEHYTPAWLACHVMDKIGYQGQEEAFFLDPACGSGVFLVEALRRRDLAGSDRRKDTGRVVGIDVNPLAVLTAKTNYLMAMDPACLQSGNVSLPIYLMDSIIEDNSGLWSESQFPDNLLNGFDYVVGNPPWVNWESLTPEYRKATLQQWQNYGLFAHSGMDTILGKGKKDLSYLMTQIMAAKYLKKEGKLAFIITQSIFKSGGAAEGFRRFRLPQGVDLKVIMAEDLASLSPFADASNRTAIIYLQRDLPTTYPVPYILWREIGTPIGRENQTASLMAEPVDPNDDTSPWLTGRGDCLPILHKILGSSGYRAHEGANTGGANGILWVEVVERMEKGLVRIKNLAGSSRAGVEAFETVIEDGLIYPLLKGRDVARWKAVPSAWIIICQDPVTRRGLSIPVMSRTYPRTLEYLSHFENELAGRAAYRRYFKDSDPFYSMFDVGEYTLAPIKVVWHRFGDRMQAAVAEEHNKAVIPQETHCMVACGSSDEAWYLAGLLNSMPVEFALNSYAMVGGKSFASPNLFNYVRFPLFEGSIIQLKIAATARGVAAGTKDQGYLDVAAAELYNISLGELAVIKEAWDEIR